MTLRDLSRETDDCILSTGLTVLFQEEIPLLKPGYNRALLIADTYVQHIQSWSRSYDDG